MPCYRSGGCGPYEMYSCSECPASKPEYIENNRIRAVFHSILTDKKNNFYAAASAALAIRNSGFEKTMPAEDQNEFLDMAIYLYNLQQASPEQDPYALYDHLDVILFVYGLERWKESIVPVLKNGTKSEIEKLWNHIMLETENILGKD